MRILIGTPVFESKNYDLEEWMQSLTKSSYPADILIADCSVNPNFVKKIEHLCQKFRLNNYKIKHINVGKWQPADEKFGRLREIIRKEAIAGNFDAWLSWQCNHTLPSDAVYKMTVVMKAGGYQVVSHVAGLKDVSPPEHSFGVDLISISALKRYGFLIDYPDMQGNSWTANGLWLKKRAIRDGGKCIELDINNEEQFEKFRTRGSTIKLNLGCGEKHLPDYINIDIVEPCDLKFDLRNPLPFKDNSVDEVFSDGNLPYLFYPSEWDSFKKEITRVLKPAGKLEIGFWDFKYLINAFLKNKDGKRWSWWQPLMYSCPDNNNEIAKNSFTYEKLASDLKEEGMERFSKTKTELPGYIHLIAFKKIVSVALVLIIVINKMLTMATLDITYATPASEIVRHRHELQYPIPPSTSLLA